jgi:hypothetical protein
MAMNAPIIPAETAIQVFVLARSAPGIGLVRVKSTAMAWITLDMIVPPGVPSYDPECADAKVTL